MKRSEYESKMADLQNQIEELKKVEIEEDKRWKPTVGDDYYDIQSNGLITPSKWISANCDEGCYTIGNCFKTKEEAKFVRERLKVLAELSEFAEPFDTKWGKDSHWYISYDHEESSLSISSISIFKGAELYFATRDDAVKAIEKVGEERIKKYYLGV